MEKKKIYLILALVIAVVLIGGGTALALKSKNTGEAPVQPDSSIMEESLADDKGSVKEEEQEGQIAEEVVIEALYIPIAEEVHLFVGEENGMVFTANFPEEIYDIEGNKITREQLERGNVLELYGNGIMLESYPGQYPGITKMVVIEQGSPSDADKYQEIVDEFYQEPDPAQPPTLDVEYTTELAIATAMVNRGGYEWTYIDKDGLSNAVVGDSLHVLHWKEQLNDIRLTEPTDLVLSFSQEPEDVVVKRWSADLMDTEDIPEGEEIEVSNAGGVITIPGAEGNYVYEVTGIWENGRAYYGFRTE